MSRGSLYLYRVLRALVEGICRTLFRLTLEGKENVPATGAFVLAPVHRSNIDFAIAACTTKRRLGFMTKDSVWKIGRAHV